MRSSECVDFLYHGMLEDVIHRGLPSSPRGHGTRELLSWTGALTNPRARLLKNPVRDLRVGYAAASVAWNVACRDDQSILWWNPNGRHILDEGRDRFYGANYGQRMMSHLHEAIHLLRADRETRRAWVPVWRPEDAVDGPDWVESNHADEITLRYSRSGKDVPCTLGFQLRLTPRLDMQVVMRSQSVGVFPYDLFLFTTLQEVVANTLGAELGVTYWHCNSLHIYDRELAQRKAESEWYNSRRYKQYGQFDADFNRQMAAAMPELDTALEDAIAEWPSDYDAIMAGGEPIDPDPIVALMWEGRPRELQSSQSA